MPPQKPFPYRIDQSSENLDWEKAKADLLADGFDNGRSPASLERSFSASAHVAYAWHGSDLVGMGRLLSDGVCNAYLVDVWTHSLHRRRGIGSALVEYLVARVPGQHVGLQSEEENLEFYTKLGFTKQPHFLARVSGEWLLNEGNA
jgi:ribosomal protein S18 acetylase RimI-like enzyme